MSTVDLQKAMARLIRFNRENWPVSLIDLNLSDKEKEQLDYLVAQREFAKFSKGMQNNRFSRAFNGIKVALLFLNENKVEFLYHNDFNPRFGELSYMDLPAAFADYLATDEKASELRKVAPDFVVDILKVESAESKMLFKIFEWDHFPIGQYLQTKKFALLDLNYNIADFISLIWQQKDRDNYRAPDHGPQPRKQKILMVKDAKGAAGKRLFEIDDETFHFLSAQLKCEQVANLPSSFDDLCELGITRRLQ